MSDLPGDAQTKLLHLEKHSFKPAPAFTPLQGQMSSLPPFTALLDSAFPFPRTTERTTEPGRCWAVNSSAEVAIASPSIDTAASALLPQPCLPALGRAQAGSPQHHCSSSAAAAGLSATPPGRVSSPSTTSLKLSP